MFFILFFFTGIYSCFSQNYIEGKILDSSNISKIRDVYVENITKNRITISNENGKFKIQADLSDTLIFRNINFHRKKIIINNEIIKDKNFVVFMEEVHYQINEVILGLKLTGDLEVDTKSIPINEEIKPIKLKYAKTTEELGNPQPEDPTIFQPIDFLHNIFSSKSQQREKLKVIKSDYEFSKILKEKYQKNTLRLMFSLSKEEVDEFIEFCGISQYAILQYNKLKILELFSICYDVFKKNKNNN